MPTLFCTFPVLSVGLCHKWISLHAIIFPDMGSQEEDGGISERQLKIVLVGDSGSGKVSLLHFLDVFLLCKHFLYHHHILLYLYCFLDLHNTLMHCKFILNSVSALTFTITRQCTLYLLNESIRCLCEMSMTGQ